MKLMILFLLFLSSCSCDKEEVSYSPTEMWQIAVEADPTIQLIPITSPEKRVLCENYPSPGCQEGSGKRILISKVELLTLQYDSPTNARAAAIKIDQWYAGNWLFDDVTNEPVLESFVQKVFHAKRPGKDLPKDLSSEN